MQVMYAMLLTTVIVGKRAELIPGICKGTFVWA